MDYIPNAAAPTTPAPVSTPTPMMAEGGSTTIGAPVQTVAPTAAPTNAASTNSGGINTSSIKEFFKTVNWVNVGFLTLGALALMSVIHANRQRILNEKTVNSDHQRQLDELKMNLQTSMKGAYKTL